MKYPYTLTAKLVQFPFKFYYQNVPMFRFLPAAFGLTACVMYYFHKQANSPANIAKWAETQRKNAEAEHHH